MNQPKRRQFLLNAGKALGGLALVNATSRWAFATKNPVSDLIHRSSWAMGTSIRVSMPQDIFTSNLADSSFKSLQRVDSLLSAHNEQSALMRMNASAGVWSNGKELVDVSRAATLLANKPLERWTLRYSLRCGDLDLFRGRFLTWTESTTLS